MIRWQTSALGGGEESMLALNEGSRGLGPYRVALVMGLLLLLATLWLPAHAAPLTLTAEQTRWIEAQKNKVFTVGFDPYAGMDDFEFRGHRVGLLPSLLKEMQNDLGLRFEKAQVLDWDDAYVRFERGDIDLLYCANPTPERERTMVFTPAAQRYPYMVLARKDSSVQTLGDLDGKKVGFIANDFVRTQLPNAYRNIHYQAFDFDNQAQWSMALSLQAGESKKKFCSIPPTSCWRPGCPPSPQT